VAGAEFIEIVDAPQIASSSKERRHWRKSGIGLVEQNFQVVGNSEVDFWLARYS